MEYDNWENNFWSRTKGYLAAAVVVLLVFAVFQLLKMAL
jgi:hypothetical protein